jgi:predicted lipoprotein with Yx(FWY)xxD motif
MSRAFTSTTLRGLTGLAAAVLFAAACSSAATTAPVTAAPPTAAPPASAAPASAAPASAAASSSAPSAAAGVVVSMATTTLGPVLVGPNGLTLYTHTGDTATSSTCTGGCASAWPPLAVPAGSSATAGAGVSGTFATLTRDDGTLQVTYNGLPLYGWMNDHAAGDTTGQGVNGFSVAKP